MDLRSSAGYTSIPSFVTISALSSNVAPSRFWSLNTFSSCLSASLLRPFLEPLAACKKLGAGCPAAHMTWEREEARLINPIA